MSDVPVPPTHTHTHTHAHTIVNSRQAPTYTHTPLSVFLPSQHATDRHTDIVLVDIITHKQNKKMAKHLVCVLEIMQIANVIVQSMPCEILRRIGWLFLSLRI